MNSINKSRVPIISYIEGICASSATFITIASKYKIIAPYGIMMIHNYYMKIEGKRELILFESKVGEKITEIIKKIYIKNTKLSEQKLNEIMENDIFFDAKESLKYGLVNKILKPISKKNLDNYYENNPEYKFKNNILLKKTNINNIYFYIDGNLNYFELAFHYIDNLHFILKKSYNPYNIKPILIHLNDISRTNDKLVILPIINTIIMSKIPIYCLIEGSSTELGMLINCVCHERLIYNTSFITLNFMNLIDESEKYENIKKNTDLSRKLIKDILEKYTKIPKNIMNNIFKENFLLTAGDTLKYGICDKILNI
jgi:ATP-dependent protease ClpP protease subunit